jgi:hypothetical protein
MNADHNYSRINRIEQKYKKASKISCGEKFLAAK